MCSRKRRTVEVQRMQKSQPSCITWLREVARWEGGHVFSVRHDGWTDSHAVIVDDTTLDFHRTEHVTDGTVAHFGILCGNWGDTCISDDPMQHFGDTTYAKGAMFLYSLEAAIGRPAIDQALATLYQANRGGTATLDDFLQVVQTQAMFDPYPCAEAWLRGNGAPTSYDCATF